MTVLHSEIDRASDGFAQSAETMRALVADLKDKLQVVSGGGGEAARSRHTSRGKMLARDRVDLLLDPGTAFLELSPLAAFGLYGGDVHAASINANVATATPRIRFMGRSPLNPPFAFFRTPDADYFA